MDQFLRKFLILGLVAGLVGCSSGGKDDQEIGEAVPDEIPVTEADTDAFPMDDLENPEGSLDAATDDLLASAPPIEEAPVAEELAQPTEVYPTEAPPAPAPVDYSASGEFDFYTVRSGDTLMKIAFEYYGDIYQWRRVYEMNRDKIPNANSVPPGTVLKVERPATPVVIERNGESYMIKDGDTLGSISYDIYGTNSKWRRLWENNRQLIKDPNKIYAGFYLYYIMTEQDRQEKGQFSPDPLANQAQGVRTPSAVDPEPVSAQDAPAVEEPAPMPATGDVPSPNGQ